MCRFHDECTHGYGELTYPQVIVSLILQLFQDIRIALHHLESQYSPQRRDIVRIVSLTLGRTLDGSKVTLYLSDVGDTAAVFKLLCSYAPGIFKNLQVSRRLCRNNDSRRSNLFSAIISSLVISRFASISPSGRLASPSVILERRALGRGCLGGEGDATVVAATEGVPSGEADGFGCLAGRDRVSL